MPKAVLIEDNANNRYLLTLLMEHAGFQVVELSHGKEAVATVHREAPDVVLLDIQMPEMDGYEVAAALKRDPIAARVPVVGVSSFAMPGDREKAMKAGFAGYIEKPVDPEHFAQSVISILGRSKPRPKVILSVDDDPQNLYLVEAAGKAQGYQVISAGNGVEALAQLERQIPDLIVSDILMPEMDGFQLCHELKSRERTRNIPFIFYTATYTSKKDEDLAMSLGASRFILKPMEPEHFLAIIEEVLGGAGVTAKPLPPVELRDPLQFLRAYTERLVQKLDRKIEQQEAARRRLEELLSERDREIAQRKRAEEERASMEAQFLQAQKLESVGRLAGGVAHDFNNYLTVINGFAQLLMRGMPKSDSRHDALAQILQAGTQASKLTRQLLAFSRRETVDPKPMSLADAVTAMLDVIRSLVGSDVKVVTKLSPVRPVIADESQFHQVLLNLIVNARDAMPDGGCLTIETASVSGDQLAASEPQVAPGATYAMLSVSDTGTGMEPSTLQHIFEPFFTTKAEGKGTGLGLSTAYGIVRQSGGFIQVDSEPGHGSRFRILLPLAEA